MEEKKFSKWDSLFIVVVVIFLIFILFNILKEEKNEVCFKKNCFEVELAITEEQQNVGLSNRTYLENNKGMLFVFNEEGDYPFWMKDMKFPLDLIWIDKNGIVVDMAKDTKPCGPLCFGIYPEKKASYVLELNANTSNVVGLDLGDKIDIKISLQ